MVAPASSSGSTQAAIDHAAALRAAEEARRRAEEAARRAAEEARRVAEEARRQAEEARKKADALDALKKEATANLREKEAKVAESKLDDVRQRRPANDPSQETRAAQTEVDAAKKTVALYEPPPKGQDKPALPSAGTQALLDKAQKAAKPVFDVQARGGDGTAAQKATLNVAVDDWLAAAQQDMRNAAVQARAEGKDPNAAIDQQAANIKQAIDDGGVFDPTSMNPSVEKARDQVKAETPAIRQLRSEQYQVNQSGKKQVADARTEAGDAEAAAVKAEKYASSFGDGPGGNDTLITAKQNAKDEAARLRGVANRANAKLNGLVKAYGTSDPADPQNPKTNVVGAVSADYEAQVADLEVQDLSDKYQHAVAGGDPKKIAQADAALRDAQDAQRYAHALADDEAAQLDQIDAGIEYTDAEAAWKAESLQQPGTYTVTERDGDKTSTKTEKAEGYDPAFWAKPGSEEGKKVQAIDGKYYYVDGDKKTELNPTTARLWAAHDMQEAAKTRTGETGKTLTQVKEDLVGGADGSGPQLDEGRYLDDADGIQQRLADANREVTAAYAGLGSQRPPGFIGPVVASTTPKQLGEALERQRTAQAEADALKAMQDLRGAERDQAAGKPVDAGKLQGLRDAAREAQRKHEEAQPKLSPQDEKKMRDTLLPQARTDAKTQSDAVDKLTAPGSTATEAQRNKALDELDAAKLTVRDYETKLELIDAERDWYAAQYQYGQADFAKPQLSMFMNDGESVTADVYPENYDPTWNLKPGADGKVSAEGLPRGLSPEDIEVRHDPCGGGYTVIVKKDSEVIGWQKSERYGDLRHFTVREGEYKMNPATARLWDSSEFGNGRLAQARSERAGVEKQLTDAAAEAPPPPEAQPLLGPDGKPVPTLRLGEDLGPRKKQVDQNVALATTARDHAQSAYDAGTGDRTALKNALDDASSRLAIAQNEQAAVDAVLLWQEAHRTRQLYEANERAGRPQTMCYAKPPAELESDARANAVAARGKWLDSHNKFYTDTAQRDLGAAQSAHDKWKSAHPGLAETGSATWQDLQAAQAKVDTAKRYQVAGATESASAREQDFIAQNLRPDQHENGAELYKLFMRDPTLMAQSLINSHYVQYGGQYTQMQGRTQLENTVATALGWKPDVALDPSTPANNERLQQTQSLFTQLSKEQQAVLDRTVDKIVEEGGDKARVMVLPVVYGLEGERGGIVKTAVFKVETKPGESKLVDEQGWVFDDLGDYRANNSLPVEGVNLVTPEDGNFTLDANGNVKLFAGDARTETGWESFRRTTHLDVVAGVVGVVAGVVLTVGSFGTLSAPGVMLIAGSAAVLAAGYGVATSAESLYRQGSHGQDINPFTSTQARLDWLNLGLSAVSVPVVGASTRATIQAMRAGNALKAAAAARGAGDVVAADKHLADFARYSQSAQGWGRPAAAAAKPLGVGSVYAFEEGARYMVDNWEHMTPGERQKQLGMLGLNAAGFASPVFARGYVRVHNAVKPQTVVAQPETVAAGSTAATGSRVTDGAEVIQLASRRPAVAADDPQASIAAQDPLQPFRESPATRSEGTVQTPDNVVPLHPEGPPPVVVAESPDAALAPVIPLVLRRPAGDGPDPGPGAVPASARRPQEQQLPLAAGGEEQAANAPYTRSPHRLATVRHLSPQASTNNGGQGTHGQGGSGQPAGSVPPASTHASGVPQASSPPPSSSGSGSGPGGPTGPSTPAAPTPPGGFRGWVARITGPTKALVAFGVTQGGAITAKLFGAGGFYDNVTGGPWATWVNQTRGLGTRGAYYPGKRGLETALEFARQGDAASAVRQVELVAKRAALRGLSPAEIASKKQKAVDQLGEFGEAVARYQKGLEDAGVPQDVAEAFPVRLASEAEIKTGADQQLAEMAPGTLIDALGKNTLLGRALHDPSASPAALARAVDAYNAGDAQTVAAFNRLRPETRERVLAAREAELGYGRARERVNEKGNLIDMKDVQGALGSTMHMGSKVGISFKYLALGFATNSGLGGSYNFVKQAFTPGAWTSAKGGLRTAGLSGEVVGNVPNIGIQWSYLRALNTRTKFSDAGPDSQVPIAEVKAYLDKRLERMEWLRDTWWTNREKWMTQRARDKAGQSIKDDVKALEQANDRGDPPPVENRTWGKHVLLRKAQANERVEAIEKAIAEAGRTGDDSHLRAMAKTESEKAAKSMNTAGDFMAIPSMYRYTFMGVLLASTGHPVLAGITMFHGIVSNGGWLRAQQGKGTIYGMRMAPRGLYEGNGLFGVGKRIGRGYNQALDQVPDSVGEALANAAKKTPVVKRFAKSDNLVDSLKLDGSTEGAANRRRIRLLLTGATAPTVNLINALFADDDGKKQAPPVQQPPQAPPGSPPTSGPSPTPTSPPTTSPSTSPSTPPSTPPITPPHEPDDPGTVEPTPVEPPVKPVHVFVDGEHRESATLWGISAHNLKTLLTPTALAEAREEGGEDHVTSEALSQLFNLNPRFDKRLMDGIVTNVEGDPDTLIDGWKIRVG